jgi:hypothetical protein
MPETKPVCRVYNVAAILWLQFMVHVMLFLIINFSTLILSEVCGQ